MKRKKSSNGKGGPVRLLQVELAALRRDLRETIRAYSARLDIHLAETTEAVAAAQGAEELPREELHAIRELTMLLRERKLKPERGRPKDLRKIDSLVEELQILVPRDRR